MKFCVCFLSILFSGYCFSAEFDNSIGFGVQYGGILGWQGSVSEENVHGRLSIGLIGAAVGADLDINNYTSIGVTAGGVGIATFKAINLNYYVDGNILRVGELALMLVRLKQMFSGRIVAAL